MGAKSSTTTPAKPSKPYPDFPLFPHATKRWAKKIRGKLVYFGRWDDPDAALQKYLDQKDDLHAGRTPRAEGDGLELRVVVNSFLTAKHRKVESGELKTSTFAEYHRVGDRLIAAFGARRRVDDLVAEDFGTYRVNLAKTLGPAELGKQVQIARSVFKFAYDSGLTDTPMRFGPEFVRPSRKALRKVRRAKPTRMFEPPQLRAILQAAPVQLRAMTLLGINCGFGNTDCSELTTTVVNLKRAMVDWPRPKTEIDRRCPLWPETVQAFKDAMAARPTPKSREDADKVFVTKYGHRWVRFHRRDDKRRGACIDSVGLQFAKLLRSLDLKQLGINFYTLRHTFRTIVDEVGDRPAIDLIMGHENAGDMAVHYRERINDDRLRAVAEYVRKWLLDDKD